jgi:hypothetical protein
LLATAERLTVSTPLDIFRAAVLTSFYTSTQQWHG